MLDTNNSQPYQKIEMISGVEIIMMSPPFSNHNVVKDNILYIFRNLLKGNVCRPSPEDVNEEPSEFQVHSFSGLTVKLSDVFEDVLI